MKLTLIYKYQILNFLNLTLIQMDFMKTLQYTDATEILP